MGSRIGLRTALLAACVAVCATAKDAKIFTFNDEFMKFPIFDNIFPETPGNVHFQSVSVSSSSASAVGTAGSNRVNMFANADLSAQLNTIFQQTGFSSDYVQSVIEQAWESANQLMGRDRMDLEKEPSIGLEDMYGQGKEGTVEVAKNALAMEHFGKAVAEQLGLNYTVVSMWLQAVTVGSSDGKRAGASFPFKCNERETPVIPIRDFFNPARHPVCARNKYRSHDGSCNNILFPSRGTKRAVLIRLTKAHYADGISVPRKAKSGKELPTSRVVSFNLIGQRANPASDWSAIFTNFGQFIDHDITSTPTTLAPSKEPLECCGADKNHPECFVITIPDDDPFYSKVGVKCMRFTRSLPGIRPGCSLGPREQQNQVSSFLDGSQIYGTDKSEIDWLREFEGGRLKVNVPDEENPDYITLPGSMSKLLCIDATRKRPCFKSGDHRCNVQIGQQVMQTVWAKHHNVIASRLAQLNPHWDDEKLYQEARHIVIAQYQHVVFNEWLAVLFGEDALEDLGLKLLTDGQRTKYNHTVHPGITNEFATAAFRFGHAMVMGVVERRDPDGNLVKPAERTEDTFFRSNRLYDIPLLDELVLGSAIQHGKSVDANIVSDLSQKLLKRDKPWGLDLVSLNVQRGRDHGIPDYMSIRKLCGLKTANSFEELKKLEIMPDDWVDKASKIYESINDLDYYVAGLAEFRHGKGIIGETHRCIISNQFWRLRHGDRFWYEHDLPMFQSSLNDGQLDQIRKTSFAKILCDAVPGLKKIQPRVFTTLHDAHDNVPANQLTPCDELEGIDLQPWKEDM